MLQASDFNYVTVDGQRVTRFDGTRFKVVHLAAAVRAGTESPAELHRAYPQLTMAQICSALACYYDNRAAFDQQIDGETALDEAERLAAPDTAGRIKLRALGRRCRRRVNGSGGASTPAAVLASPGLHSAGRAVIVRGMGAIRAVTVYCSSSDAVDPVYFDAARAVGRGVAGSGWTLVYGGNFVGLMGAVAQAARDAGGRVVGVTPRLLHDRGLTDTACDELVVTEGMRERKALLERRADAFVVLPGGTGTFEELFEVYVGRQLGYHAKPVVVVDVDGYYRPLLAMLDHGVEQRFIKRDVRDLLHVAGSAEEAVEYLRQWRPTGPVDDGQPSSAIE